MNRLPSRPSLAVVAITLTVLLNPTANVTTYLAVPGTATAYAHPGHSHSFFRRPVYGPEKPTSTTEPARMSIMDSETAVRMLAAASARSTGWIAYSAATSRLPAFTINTGLAGDALDRAFAPFVQRKEVVVRRDDRYFYVESKGVPNHPMMVGIRAWQQQVPLPQPYQGGNAWRIPVHPVPAKEPISAKDRFLRGAIALAVNGVPIFNPFNNRGEDAYLIGELDEYGGHCGRADDYHYHIAPVHLEKQLGKGAVIAYALDGYPIYGYTEPDGSKPIGLDAFNGHADAQGNYHYHASPKYPYLNGGFHGEVVEREGQVDPQPRAQGVREALPPLRGARIIGFTAVQPNSYRLTYDINGRQGKVEYTLHANGSVTFTYTDPDGQTTTELGTPRRRGPGGKPEGKPERKPDGRPERKPDGKPERKPERKPDGKPERKPMGKVDGKPERPDGQPDGKPQDRPGDRSRDRPAGSSASTRPMTPAIKPQASSAQLTVSIPGLTVGQKLPVDHTCDGAGVSPPVAWTPGPAGTQAYALCLWHQSPDQLKSYWVVHDIPANVHELPKDSRTIGRLGINDKRKAAYDPMCSKGPGAKTYHITVYALSRSPAFPAAGATRAELLDAIQKITLAQGTVDLVSERGERAQ